MEINKNDAKSKKVNKSNNKLEKRDKERKIKYNKRKNEIPYSALCKLQNMLPCNKTMHDTVCILYFVY